MDELVYGVDFTNMLFRYELFMMMVGLNKNCSYGNNNVGLLMCFNRVIVSVIVLHSCLLLSTCRAYADCGSFCFM